jgi:LacI family transcriptional regulator
MRMSRTGVIGILVWDIEPHSAEVLKGSARALCEADYELVMCGGRAGRRPHELGGRIATLSHCSPRQ